MATHRVELSPSHIATARALADSGADGMTTWSDVVEKGLRLRVRGRSAAWSLSWGDVTRSLGTIDEVKTVKAARELAAAVRALLKSGDGPANYIAARHAGRDHQESVDAALRRKAIAAGAWKWSELVDRYVTDHVGAVKLTKKGPRAPSDKAVSDARRYLNDPGLSELSDVYLPDLKLADIEKARNVARSRSPSAGRKVVQYSK